MLSGIIFIKIYPLWADAIFFKTMLQNVFIVVPVPNGRFYCLSLFAIFFSSGVERVFQVIGTVTGVYLTTPARTTVAFVLMETPLSQETM